MFELLDSDSHPRQLPQANDTWASVELQLLLSVLNRWKMKLMSSNVLQGILSSQCCADARKQV